VVRGIKTEAGLMASKNILIVDRDLGFVFSLGQMLDRAGYAGWPARSVEDASALMAEFNLEIDLLIVNPALKGAAAFIQGTANSQGRLKVIVIESGPGESTAAAFPKPDATLAKPPVWDPASQAEWLNAVEQLIPERGGNARSSGC
jgi:DNA-binding NtrC family response regulator